MVARDFTYLDFDVLLERAEHDTYRARVVNAPAGQTPPVAFPMPFTPLELENFLLRIGRPRRVVRRIDAPETAAIKTFGGQLYRALFHDDLEVNFLRSLSEATAQRAGLRIRLRLSDTPELAELPWEFLYDQTRNRFLCLSDRTPLIRFLEVPDPPRPLAVSPPLHVLVMIASPSDYPPLDVQQEWTKLRTALAPLEQAGQVQVTQLETATMAALLQQLRRADCHVLHFIGHGGFDPRTQDGVLVLEDQTGRSRLVSGQDLGILLHDHHPLRLVVLNACEGARADPSDPFAGAAQGLIQQAIPAVVAMQFEITDPAAISFASELYAAIADGYPLDAALAEARKAIWVDGNQVEWATPVLHLRAPDGRIFDIAPAPAATSQPATATFTPPASAVAPPKEATRPGPTAKASPDETTTSASAHPDSGWLSTKVRTFEFKRREDVSSAYFSSDEFDLEGIYGVDFSPDGRRLATSSNDGLARIWDADSGEELHTLSHDYPVYAVAFTADGRLLATGSDDCTVRFWDADSGERQLRTLSHDKPVFAVAFGPEGRLLATGGDDGTVRIWPAQSGKRLRTLRHDDGVRAVAFRPDGRWLATGSDDHTARIRDANSGEELHTFYHHGKVNAVAFSPDGLWLATGSGNEVRIWPALSGEERDVLSHDGKVYAVAFSPDGRWLVTGSGDNTARIWDTDSGRRRRTLRHNRMVYAVAFSLTGDFWPPAPEATGPCCICSSRPRTNRACGGRHTGPATLEHAPGFACPRGTRTVDHRPAKPLAVPNWPPGGSGAAAPGGALRAIDSSTRPRSWRTYGRRRAQACPGCHAGWYG
jgi:hypothetical protein